VDVLRRLSRGSGHSAWLTIDIAEDGKEMKVDLETTNIKDIVEQVDRHSRMLNRKEQLNG